MVATGREQALDYAWRFRIAAMRPQAGCDTPGRAALVCAASPPLKWPV